MRIPAFLSLLPLIFAGSLASAQFKKPSPTDGLGVEPKFDQQVPLNLTFSNEKGENVKLSRYVNGTKPVILVLVYYKCPRLCSFVLTQLAKKLKMLASSQFNRVLGKHYEVVTVSIDPREKHKLAAAKKKAYQDEHEIPGMEEAWHFLTGEADQSEKLARSVGFSYAYDKVKGEYLHGTCFIVLTPHGKVSRYLYDLEANTTRVKDLNLSLVDASKHKINKSIKERVQLLFCYSYDPTTGRYSVSVLNLVRVGGAITLLILGGCLLRFWRSERKKETKAVN